MAGSAAHVVAPPARGTGTGTVDARGWRGAVVPAVAGLIALLAAAAFAWGGVDFSLDDAWIHLAYARSIRLGEGFSYNPHDWETGASSPLWVALLSLLPIDSNPLLAVKALGACLHALTAVLATTLGGVLARRVSGQHGRARIAAGVAGVLVAFHPPLLQAAASGMEVGLASALVLATALIVWSPGSRPWLALVAGAAAVLARPETLFFTGALAVALLGDARGRLARWVFAGSLAALGGWVLYCMSASGYPWPNTRYVKAAGGDASGLAYVAVQVLPWQPWLVGVGGLALAAVGCVRSLRAGERASLALVVAWLATVAATACSRPLDPQVFFYLSRYFEIVAAVPVVVVAVGLVYVRTSVGALALAPVALVTALQVIQLHARVHAQEHDIQALHTTPARFIARTLPARSVVIAEGAGATRFATPRSMTIVDMLGLNDRALAHAAGDLDRVCSLLRRHATHVLVPDRFLGPMSALFELRAVRVFATSRYALTTAFAPRRVLLLEITGVANGLEQRCGLIPGAAR